MNKQHMKSDQNLPLVIKPAHLAEALPLDVSEYCVVDLSSKAQYLAGHIPGAVHLPFQHLVTGHGSVPGKLPGTAQLLSVFSYLGLQEHTHLFVCDDEGGGWAGRFIWTLDVIGHQRCSYIDGGMIAWKALSLPLECEPRHPRSVQINSLQQNRTPIADMDQVFAAIANDTAVIWDARSPEEYLGQRTSATKNGHIPGAINIPWTDLMAPTQHYQIRSDAREYLAKHGIDGRREIITHCQTHHRSGFTYLVGKALGYAIKAYDGSWAEWGNHPQTPVEK